MYRYFVTGWDVLLMLDRINRARHVYNEMSDENERREMDKLFADCYDWLANRGVAIYYDEKPEQPKPRLF